jgi:hypothetical protein
MAGSQFLTPKSVQPSRPKRRFTLAQANSALPLVKRIVRDIVRTHNEAMKAQAALDRPSSGGSGATQQEAQGRLASHLEHLEDFVDELTEVGCELKDYRLGLVDFTGRHLGRDVCLCWKLGEERIGYWHESDKGFSGRQPITTLRETD